MSLITALTLASLTITATALGALRSDGFLSVNMRPDEVSRLLSHVEDTWKTKAHAFSQCVEETGAKTPGANGAVDCGQSMSTFAKSCGKIAFTIVQSSFGNVKDVNEYMDDVCNRAAMPSGWHQTTCATFGKIITSEMSGGDADNRDHFASGKACLSLWSHFLAEQKEQRAEQVKREKAEAEKEAKAEEEAAKAEEQAKAKLSAEKAEAEKQAKAKLSAQKPDATTELAKSVDQEAAKAAAVAEAEEEDAAKVLAKAEAKAEAERQAEAEAEAAKKKDEAEKQAKAKEEADKVEAEMEAKAKEEAEQLTKAAEEAEAKAKDIAHAEQLKMEKPKAEKQAKAKEAMEKTSQASSFFLHHGSESKNVASEVDRLLDAQVEKSRVLGSIDRLEAEDMDVFNKAIDKLTKEQQEAANKPHQSQLPPLTQGFHPIQPMYR